jgi:hypothetical protein
MKRANLKPWIRSLPPADLAPLLARALPWLLLAGVLAAGWTFWPRETAEVGVATVLPPAVEVRTVEKIVERPRIVYVYPRAAKARLDLPPAVQADPAKAVTATGKLDAEDRPYTLSAVLDVATGESQVYARPDPLPWIGPGRRGGVGAAYGLGGDGPTARLYGWHDLLRLKALHAGARGELDQAGEWFAGGYVEWRF